MKQKNLILMVVAVGCGLVAAFLTTQINAKPKVEQVEVYVAVKDLPVGTTFTKEELGKLVTKKKVSKDSLPPAFVIDEQEFLDKRLSRAVMKDETFNPGTLTKGGVITLPDGFDLCTLPLTSATGLAGFVTPGAKVDVLATMRLQNRLLAFPLLVDMLVLAVDNHVDTTKQQGGVFPTLSSVSFAATQEQALLLALAKIRGCHLELTLRHPGKPVDAKYDIKKVMALIQDDKNPAKSVPTEGKEYGGEFTELPISPTPIAPDPTAKEEEVKVWVATEKIPAGTEFTKELVEKKLKVKDMPRRYAVGAYSDLAPLVDQKLTLKTDLNVDQWVADTIVGPAAGKPTPLETWQPPKGVAAEPKVIKPVARQIRDIAVHTPSGTVIHRFEEIAPGNWKLKAILTQEEATKLSPKDPDQPVSPDPKKSER